MQDGRIMTTTKEEDLFVKDVKHPRTAVGYTKDHKLIILVIQGRFPGLAEGASIAQEAVIFRDLGCYEALNLDGGGSSCLLINGKTTIQPCDKEGQRPVPSVLLIQEKK
jgi:exopolysaccharide biosynthesis protein